MPPAQGYRCDLCVWLLYITGHLNLGFHAHVASILLAEPSPQLGRTHTFSETLLVQSICVQRVYRDLILFLKCLRLLSWSPAEARTNTTVLQA